MAKRKNKKRSSPALILLVLLVSLVIFLYGQYGEKLGLPDIFSGCR